MFVTKKKYNDLRDSFDVLFGEYQDRCEQVRKLTELMDKQRNMLIEIKEIVDYYKNPDNKCKKDRFIKTIENKYSKNEL